MYRLSHKVIALTIMLLLLPACGAAASPAPLLPSAASLPTLGVPSPTFTALFVTPSPGETAIKFSYQPPAPKLSLPSVLFRDTGAVAYHDGQFHLFYNCQYDWPPTEVNIAYAVSQDGLEWQQARNDSIITEADIPYPVFSILASSAIVMDDGTWVLYFYTWANGMDYWPPSLIGRATASSPAGPWTVDPAPVLLPGSQGWDSDSVQRPDVIRVGDLYYLYYVGTGPAGSMVGMATSSDGIHWTKYDDPASTDDLFAQSDPVFTVQQAGAEYSEIRYPRVRFTPDGWLLFYWVNNPQWPQLNPLDPPNGLIGLAAGADGIHWTRVQEEPILAPHDIGSGASAIYTPNVLFVEDVYYLYIEMEFYTSTTILTRIVLATHQGLLFP